MSRALHLGWLCLLSWAGVVGVAVSAGCSGSLPRVEPREEPRVWRFENKSEQTVAFQVIDVRRGPGGVGGSARERTVLTPEFLTVRPGESMKWAPMALDPLSPGDAMVLVVRSQGLAWDEAAEERWQLLGRPPFAVTFRDRGRNPIEAAGDLFRERPVEPVEVSAESLKGGGRAVPEPGDAD